MKTLFLLTFILLSANLASAAPLLSVTGQCHKKVQPDRVAIVMSARALEKDASLASKKVTAQYEALRKDVRKLDLKDLQLRTDNYSISPEWEYGNNKRTLRGYNASMGLRIETSDLQRIGELLMLSAKLGIQDVGSPLTFLSNDLAQREYEACLKVAVQSARSKAEKMANAAGLSVKDLASLNETRPSAEPVPMAAAMEEKAMDQASAPTIEIAPETVDVTVYASYNLK